MPYLAEQFLAHYETEGYDPVKAHEYYMKNRELKDRQSTKGMSDVQREAMSLTKSKIDGTKQVDLTVAQEANKARLEALAKSAEAAKTRIQEKLKALIKSLQFQQKVPLVSIPTNASQATIDRLTKKNAEARALNAKASAEAVDKAKTAAGEELKKVGAEMKDAISKARTDYEAAKKQITDKADTDAANEADKIRAQLPGNAPKAPKAAKGTKASGEKKAKGTGKAKKIDRMANYHD